MSIHPPDFHFFSCKYKNLQGGLKNGSITNSKLGGGIKKFRGDIKLWEVLEGGIKKVALVALKEKLMGTSANSRGAPTARKSRFRANDKSRLPPAACDPYSDTNADSRWSFWGPSTLKVLFFLLPGKVCLTLFGQNSSEWVKRLFFFRPLILSEKCSINFYSG